MNKIITFTLVFPIILLLESCVSSPITPAISAQKKDLTATLSVEVPTIVVRTNAVIPTRTLPPAQPTRTYALTSTLDKLTLTQSPTQAMSTLTPLPTLAVDEATEKVLDLIQNNAGCELPCWWGVTPGRTNLGTVQHELAPLGEIFDKFDFMTKGGTVEIEVPSHNLGMIQYYLAKENIVDMVWIHSNSTSVQNNHQVYGDPKFTQVWENYLLPQLLENYGVPSEVIIETFPGAFEKQDIGYVPFFLMVFFREKGILVIYEGNNIINGNQIIICPQKADIYMLLWPPDNETTLEEIFLRSPVTYFGGLADFRSIEDSTNMDIETFYQTFKGADPSTCFTTPKEFWE